MPSSAYPISEIQTTKTGKAVKFVNNVNEFWVDRDYNQRVTLTITNTDMISHNFQLSIANPYEDIVVGFVGDGSNGRGAILQPGESTDVELIIHAPDAQKTIYDLYLKMVSDEGEYDSFVDYSHAIVHVRPFVANLDIQPVQSDPGMMTNRFRLINYGDTLSDIEVYVDDGNRNKIVLNPTINHYQLQNGEFIEFEIKSEEYVNGTVYARSGNYVVSSPFAIGCPPDTTLNTYTINDVGIMAEIKDWYCTNKMHLNLPFSVPQGFDHANLAEAALEVNFELPMSYGKYDPHTVKLSINGHEIETMENVIPEGKHIFRFPPSLINLGFDGPAQNILSVDVEGIGEGQYIVVTDFKVYLNVDQMTVNLCVPPPPPTKHVMPKPETKIKDIQPNKKFRPGDAVEITFKLDNNDSLNTPYKGNHTGRLKVLIENDSHNGIVPPYQQVWNITVPPGGEKIFPGDFKEQIDIEALIYTIPDNSDDIEYKITVTFENVTMNSIYTEFSRPGFWVRTPLIIVHGVAGSKLKNIDTNDIVWGGLTDFALAKIEGPFFEDFLDDLICKDDGSSVNNILAIQPIRKLLKIDDINIPGITIDVFDSLQKHLLNDKYNFHPSGISVDAEDHVIDLSDNFDEDVFYFIYDWRINNGVNADNGDNEKNTLKNLILALTGSNNYKINIVAHSMGGLITKSLIAQDEFIRNKINKVIFAGTPHLGAVKAFASLLYGDNDFGIEKYNYLNLVHSMSSAYQLLPSEQYFNQENYPEGFYTLNDNSISYFSEYSLHDIMNIYGNTSLFENAVSFHRIVDNDNYLNSDKTYSIAGCKKPTLTSVKEKLNVSPSLRQYLDGDGDETVPLKSALAVNATKKYAVRNGVHSNLPSHKGAKRLIRSILKGHESEFDNILSDQVALYRPELCGLDVGYKITLPTFPDIETPPFVWPSIRVPGCPDCVSTFTGNKIHLGILGSDYRITNEGVEIFIPEGPVYTLEFHGIDKEYLDIKVQLMKDGGVIKTYVFADFQLDIEGCGKINIDLRDVMTNPVLELDYTCDGVTDQALPPSDILDESQSSDITAPATTANIAGTLGLNDWYVSNVSIDLTATDNVGGSGVFATKYRLNGDVNYRNYAGAIKISEPGNYTLTYYSIDRNLNKETPKVLEFKVDNKLPVITNVEDEGFYSLNNTALSATVNVESFSGIQDVCYSAGTAPGLTDVVGWICGSADTNISITGLSLYESCSRQYFINARVKNYTGTESEVVSSNGIKILDPAADNDGDGFDNQSEVNAQSDPCNKVSIVGATVIDLKKGFNLISFPAETLYYEKVFNFMEALGGPNIISSVLLFDSTDQTYDEAGYDKQGQFYGHNTALPAGEGIAGMIVYAKQDASFTFTSKYCHTWNLKAGTNLVGTPCAAGNMTAFELLHNIGDETFISSIQRYNRYIGLFETTSYKDGRLVGVDFPIKAGEGYFIYMKQNVTGFNP